MELPDFSLGQFKTQRVVVVNFVVNPLGEIVFTNIEEGVGDLNNKEIEQFINGRAIGCSSCYFRNVASG